VRDVTDDLALDARFPGIQAVFESYARRYLPKSAPDSP